MPRYLIQRAIGEVSDEDLRRVAMHSKRVREQQFPEITWEHSHVVRVPEGLRTFCVYSAPNEEMVRAHARAADLPVDLIQEIHTDVDPEKDL